MTPAELVAELDEHGLLPLGHFSPDEDEALPAIAADMPAASLVLIGHVGSSHWSRFTDSPEYLDGQPDPLDRWSRRIGDSLAACAGGRALYPFEGPPFHPFQRWAMRARALHASPLGILIDAEFGLWQAFRFALLLPEPVGEATVSVVTSAPCDECVGQPCLAACPVGATTPAGFDHHACADHLLSHEHSACRNRVCVARAACPVAPQWRYQSSHARFHIDAFVGGLLRRGDR